jgi:hypothetical protein
LKHSVTELPFNRFLGVEVATEPTQLLRLPAGARYLNHLGTVHASAQLALAEASSGEFLLRALGSTAGVVPVVRRLESKFRRPANGAVTSTVSTPQATLEQLRSDLAAKGRAMIKLLSSFTTSPARTHFRPQWSGSLREFPMRLEAPDRALRSRSSRSGWTASLSLLFVSQ